MIRFKLIYDCFFKFYQQNTFIAFDHCYKITLKEIYFFQQLSVIFFRAIIYPVTFQNTVTANKRLTIKELYVMGIILSIDSRLSYIKLILLYPLFWAHYVQNKLFNGMGILHLWEFSKFIRFL